MAQYDLQWKRYRRLCIWFVAIFCSFGPVTIGGAVISQKLFHTDAPFPYVAGFLMLLWAVLLPHMCARLSSMWQMLHRRMVVRKLVLHHPLSSLWAAARPKGHICICIPLIIERKLVCRASFRKPDFSGLT